MGIDNHRLMLIDDFTQSLKHAYTTRPYDTPLELMFDILNNSPHSFELNGTGQIGSTKQRRFADITLSEWISIFEYYQKTRGAK